MNTFRFVAFSLFVLLILFMFAIPKPEFKEQLKTADLPWNIIEHEDGSTEVFGLRFATHTLQDAVNRFHEPEDIAIFRGESDSSLEAYFGTVAVGPLEAKLVLTLEASQQEFEDYLQRAKGLSLSGGEDRKIELNPSDEALSLDKHFTGITFIPKYSGLETDFFKQRFGEPHAWLRLNENTIQYFYPQKGLSITVDAEGKEILQYSHPADFTVPADATLNTPIP